MARTALARAAAAVFAISCAALAAREVRSVCAEAEYTEGIGAPTDAPGRDAPGRLDRYLAARAIDPEEPLYALRCGQILLTRAGSLRGVERTAQLAAALAHVEAAVAGAPLDPRGRSEAGRILDALGRDAEAAVHLDAALVVGRRHPAALDTVGRTSARRFARTRDPAELRRALAAAAEGLDILRSPAPGASGHGSAPGTGGVRQLLAQTAGPSADEVFLAAGDDVRLVGAAAELMPTERGAERTRILAEIDRLRAAGDAK